MPTRRNFPARKIRRREEAEKRATDRADRSIAEQLALITQHPGKSKREQERLAKKEN